MALTSGWRGSIPTARSIQLSLRVTRQGSKTSRVLSPGSRMAPPLSPSESNPLRTNPRCPLTWGAFYQTASWIQASASRLPSRTASFPKALLLKTSLNWQTADCSFLERYPISVLSGPCFSRIGTEDRTFNLNGTYFQRATPVPDGKVLLSAGTDPQATVLATLSRMNRDGSLDQSFFLPGSIRLEQVIRNDEFEMISRLYVGSHVLALQADGKILFEVLLIRWIFSPAPPEHRRIRGQ